MIFLVKGYYNRGYRMDQFINLLQHFFTHKDFLPPANQWPGTLFTPLQIGFCLVIAIMIGFACINCAKKRRSLSKKSILNFMVFNVYK